MHKCIVLKTILKYTLKLALKQHIYAATSPHTDVFYLAILTTVTLASTSNALPDDGVTDCTETCRSCCNVNFNVNYRIVFKTIHLYISW
jgi:hypothetical protein